MEIFITENGSAAADELASDEIVYDTGRVRFLRCHLTELQRATAEGVPVNGYFLWNLMDTFEWSAGDSNRFGVVYVDFQTQQRTPKMSAHYYKEVMTQNAVVPLVLGADDGRHIDLDQERGQLVLQDSSPT